MQDDLCTGAAQRKQLSTGTPVRGRKATEMRCCRNPSSIYKANIIKCSGTKNSGLDENEHTSKKESK